MSTITSPIHVNSLSELRDRLENDDLQVISSIFSALKKGILRKRKHRIGVLLVQVGSDRSELTKLTLPRTEWKKTLNGVMKVFAKYEMFEECMEARELLKELEIS